MPARRRTPDGTPPLTDDDVVALRARLAAGEAPRVVVRTASAAVAAGTRGSVMRLGDPAEDEYVVVRLGRDEVPFAPSELSLPTRGRAVAAASPPPVATPPPPPGVAPLPSSSRSPSAASPSSSATSRPATASRSGAAKPAARSAAAGKSRSPRRAVAPLTVTLRFRDGDWLVEAQRGARRLTRPAILRPGAVSAFAEHIDDEALREALVETVESCRAVVEERAAALRSELADAEDALRAYDAKPGRRTPR